MISGTPGPTMQFRELITMGQALDETALQHLLDELADILARGAVLRRTARPQTTVSRVCPARGSSSLL